MSTITNPALLAIAQAKYRNEEALEESRQTLDRWHQAVITAKAKLAEQEGSYERQAKHHAKLQAERTELTKAEALLEESIKKDKVQA